MTRLVDGRALGAGGAALLLLATLILVGSSGGAPSLATAGPAPTLGSEPVTGAELAHLVIDPLGRPAPAGPVADVSRPDRRPDGSSGPTIVPMGPTPAGPEGAARGGAGATSLRFVYFVEADQEFDPRAPTLIEEQAIALQRYWFEQFGGTFRLHDPVVEVVFGERPAAWYDDTPAGDDDRWFRLTNIRAEVRQALGIDPDDAGARIVTYPVARIDGRVGANRYDGAWLDGDDIACIAGTTLTVPYATDYPANCLATAAHELGHVYGLGHEGPDEGCMQFGFYRYVLDTEMCDFPDEHRQRVVDDPRNTAWLDAEPGDHLGR